MENDIWATMTEEGVLQTPETGQADHKERTVAAARAAEVPFKQDWQAAGKGTTADHLIL